MLRNNCLNLNAWQYTDPVFSWLTFEYKRFSLDPNILTYTRPFFDSNPIVLNYLITGSVQQGTSSLELRARRTLICCLLAFYVKRFTNATAISVICPSLATRPNKAFLLP